MIKLVYLFCLVLEFWFIVVGCFCGVDDELFIWIVKYIVGFLCWYFGYIGLFVCVL